MKDNFEIIKDDNSYSNIFGIDDVIVIALATTVGAKIANAKVKRTQAIKKRKDEYKKALVNKLITAKQQQEEERQNAKDKETNLIIIGSLSLLSLSAIFYLIMSNRNKTEIN
jgi:hypothetical protein